MRKEDSDKLKYLYFTLSVMILMLHAVELQYFNASYTLSLLYRYLRVICNMAVPMFFLLSAVMLYRSPEKDYFLLLKNKFQRLAVPYIAWSIILWACQSVKALIKGQDIGSLTQIFTDILLCKHNSVLWFIRVLLIYILFYKIIFRLVQNRYLISIVIIITFFVDFIWLHDNGYGTSLYWLPVYLSGAFIGVHFKELFFEYDAKCKYMIPIYIISTVAFFALCTMGNMSNTQLLYITRCFSPFFMWIMADAFKMLSEEPPWWCSISFYIYCSQLLLCSVIRSVYIKFAGNSGVSLILGLFVIPGVILLLQILTAKIMKKYFSKLWSILTGAR